jgi:hypothetical protein
VTKILGFSRQAARDDRSSNGPEHLVSDGHWVLLGAECPAL